MADENNKTPQNPENTPEPAKTPSTDELLEKISNLESQLEKTKRAMDKASSEASDWRNKWKSTLDDAAKAEEERKEREAEKDKRIAELTRRETVSTLKASYLSMGYPEDLAGQAAEALADGDISKANETQKTFLSKYKTDIEAGLLNSQPKLTPGTPPTPEQAQAEQIKMIRKAAGLES